MRRIPLVSVVIPTYNRPQQTIAAIRSVRAQSISDLEVIVVDDGSTDGSSRILDQFAEENQSGPPIRLIHQSNHGQSFARNVGIANARGQYIAFLDSDDVWASDKLELQLQALSQFKDLATVCFTDVRLVNDSGLDVRSFEVHGRGYREAMGVDRSATRALAESFSGFWISSLLARAETIRKVGGFSEDITFAEDRDLEFRLSLVTSFAYVNKPLVSSDRNPSPLGQTCRPWDDPEVQFRAQRQMLEKWLSGGMVLPGDVRKVVRRTLGGLHSHEANWHLENARFVEARRSMVSALRYKKSPGAVAKFALTWLAPGVARRVAPKTRPLGSGGHAS